MLQGQKDIQQSLQKLMKEMQQSSNKHGQGDLKGISQDIKDVISDLSKSNYTRNTKNKQRRILSRMLDSLSRVSGDAKLISSNRIQLPSFRALTSIPSTNAKENVFSTCLI